MRRPLLLITLLGASLVPCMAATDAPPGWHLAGTQPQSYRTGAEGGTAFLVSKLDVAKITGFGTLMQSFEADEFQGKRVRFRATVRSESVSGWAGLWMRVDRGEKIVAFDNMSQRPISGTTAWTTYEVLLNVPADATSIAFGALLNSNGGIWLREVQFGPVGLDVPQTGMQMPLDPRSMQPPGPVNLDFKQ